jgi:hypothetical protein
MAGQEKTNDRQINNVLCQQQLLPILVFLVRSDAGHASQRHTNLILLAKKKCKPLSHQPKCHQCIGRISKAGALTITQHSEDTKNYKPSIQISA